MQATCDEQRVHEKTRGSKVCVDHSPFSETWMGFSSAAVPLTLNPSGFPSPPRVSFPKMDERFALCGPRGEGVHACRRNGVSATEEPCLRVGRRGEVSARRGGGRYRRVGVWEYRRGRDLMLSRDIPRGREMALNHGSPTRGSVPKRAEAVIFPPWFRLISLIFGFLAFSRLAVRGGAKRNGGGAGSHLPGFVRGCSHLLAFLGAAMMRGVMGQIGRMGSQRDSWRCGVESCRKIGVSEGGIGRKCGGSNLLCMKTTMTSGSHCLAFASQRLVLGSCFAGTFSKRTKGTRGTEAWKTSNIQHPTPIIQWSGAAPASPRLWRSGGLIDSDLPMTIMECFYEE